MGKKNLDRAPYLGIFWLVNGKLIIDSSALSEAEHYGDTSHIPAAMFVFGQSSSVLGKFLANLSTRNILVGE